MSNSVHPSPKCPPRSRSAGRRRRRSLVAGVRCALRDAAAELRQLDGRLAGIGRELPQPDAEFDVLAELRGAVDVVRTDLLADAIDTLASAAAASEPALRCRFAERQGWLAAAGD